MGCWGRRGQWKAEAHQAGGPCEQSHHTGHTRSRVSLGPRSGKMTQDRLIQLHIRTGGDQTGSFSCTQKPSGWNLKGSLSKKCLRFFAENHAKQGHERIHPRSGKWQTHGKMKGNSPGKCRALGKKPLNSGPPGAPSKQL